MMLEQGILLQDRYRIVEVLGGGGMGRVYLTHDTRLADRPCAAKELVPDPHATPEEREQAAVQFHREAAILAHLSHPNLPNVSDYFEQGGNFYLVMDSVEGETLLDRLNRSPKGLPEQEVVTWAIQLCEVLDYLHSQNPSVIFRDMKPSNVMVTPDGTIKLIDFGVVRLFDPGKRTDTLKMGTAGYAPPEQYAGQGQTTPRSDVYSLGATIYELLTGDDPTAHPFVFTPPRQLKRGISQRLSDVVMRALSLDPDARFPAARAMSQALQKATRPRGLRLPAVQRRCGTGTAVMATGAVIPARRGRAARLTLGLLRWLGRITLTLVVALVILALVLLFAAAFALSTIAERAIAETDWGLTENAPQSFTLTEDELGNMLQSALEPYVLDTVSEIRADFRPPDRTVLSLLFLSYPVHLEAGLMERNGMPVITLERLNGVPLYVVGGIISNGINRGFEEAWEGAPIRISSVTAGDDRVTVTLERVSGRSTPPPTSTSAYATICISNELGQGVTVDIGDRAYVGLGAHATREISLPAGTYTYTIMVGDVMGAQGEITWESGRQEWTIR
jgi:serine/threonine-protein kinase